MATLVQIYNAGIADNGIAKGHYSYLAQVNNKPKLTKDVPSDVIAFLQNKMIATDTSVVAEPITCRGNGNFGMTQFVLKDILRINSWDESSIFMRAE